MYVWYVMCMWYICVVEMYSMNVVEYSMNVKDRDKNIREDECMRERMKIEINRNK